MAKNIVKNLLFVIEQIVGGAVTIFSRNSLNQKLRVLEDLQCCDNRCINRAMKRFESQNLIKSFNRKGQVFYELTERGLKKIAELNFKNRKQQKWDGFWRVIIWDIPEEKKAVREALRRKLKFFNFYPLQKSVFVYPFDCKNEIDEIAEFFGVEEYLHTILAKSLGRKEEELQNFFKADIRK